MRALSNKSLTISYPERLIIYLLRKVENERRHFTQQKTVKKTAEIKEFRLYTFLGITLSVR